MGETPDAIDGTTGGPALPPPADRRHGFKPDPLTDGAYARWWSGDAWADATKPAGGPLLTGAVPPARPDRGSMTASSSAPWSVHTRAVAASVAALALLVGGVALYLVPMDGGSARVVVAWVLWTAAFLLLQASVVAFVLHGVRSPAR